MVDSRPCDDDEKPSVPDEADAAAFLSLRATLLMLGVDLLDAVVVNGEQQWWWSMHELTSGTTTWTFRDADELAAAQPPSTTSLRARARRSGRDTATPAMATAAATAPRSSNVRR